MRLLGTRLLFNRFRILRNKLVDTNLEFYSTWMTHIVYLTKFIHQANERNSWNWKVFDQRMFTIPTSKSQMNDISPFFCLNSFNNIFLVLINAHSNNLHFSRPGLFVFFKHSLVMLHWSLAGSAPCCPNIYEQNFSHSGFQMKFSLLKNIGKLSIISKGISDRQALRKVNW